MYSGLLSGEVPNSVMMDKHVIGLDVVYLGCVQQIISCINCGASLVQKTNVMRNIILIVFIELPSLFAMVLRWMIRLMCMKQR